MTRGKWDRLPGNSRSKEVPYNPKLLLINCLRVSKLKSVGKPHQSTDAVLEAGSEFLDYEEYQG
jgi:hypothetical protein